MLFSGALIALALSFAPRRLTAQAHTAHTPASQTSVRPLSYTRLQLPNGLVALFNEDHSAPIVGVAVWYSVGGKDEVRGHTGLAHLCEHMMFEGSPNVRSGELMSILRSGGATSTHWAEATEDRTLYYETIPSNMLETALWLESDRMAARLSAVDSTRFAIAVGAIRNERQAVVENQTFGIANELTIEALFDADHPYRGALGPMDDLNRATLAEMQAFCAPFYMPNNAVVALSGDFDTDKTKKLIQKYFGSIERGLNVTHAVVRPSAVAGEQRIVLEDRRARDVRFRIAWVGSGFATNDKVTLNALASSLQGDRTSGLTKVLVYDRRLVTFVNVGHFDLQQAGIFQIEVLPRAGASLTEIENVIDSMVNVARSTPPSPRALRRFQSSNAVTAVSSLQGRLFRADTLAQGEAWAGDPVIYAKQVDFASRLTPADVQRAAVKYLTDRRVVMSMIPEGKLDLIAKPDRKYVRASATAGPKQ